MLSLKRNKLWGDVFMSRNKRIKVKKKKSFASIIVMTFMVFFLTVISINLFVQLDTYSKLKEQEAIIQKQIDEETLKGVQLASQEEYRNSDAYIEKVAREQLGLIKSNEILFINRAKK